MSPRYKSRALIIEYCGSVFWQFSCHGEKTWQPVSVSSTFDMVLRILPLLCAFGHPPMSPSCKNPLDSYQDIGRELAGILQTETQDGMQGQI